jgi:lysophospholipase L1-like esterase
VIEARYKANIYAIGKDEWEEKRIEFVQYDSETGKVEMTTYNKENDPMTDIFYAALTIVRPNGEVFTYGGADGVNPYDCFVIDGNVVTLTMPPGAVYAVGKHKATVAVYAEGMKRLTVADFDYVVRKDYTSDAPLDESDNYMILTDLINRVEAIPSKEDEWEANEATRQEQEEERETKDDARDLAEQQRSTEFAVMKSNYETATRENTAIELVEARKGKVNLREKIDEIDSSLAEKTTEINNVKTDLLENDAKIIDANTNIASLQSQLTNIGNGTPKSIYPTVSALQTAYPTGTTGVYLVINPITDGKDYVYYWNGSAWTRGSAYQSTGIADTSITPEKTNFINITKTTNLFNRDSSNNVGGYYLNLTGTPTVQSGYMYSHLIPIKNGITYTYKVYAAIFGANAKQLLLYDASGNFLAYSAGTIDASNTYNTITINNTSAVYAKVNLATSDLGNFMFVEGNAYPNTYSAYHEPYYSLGSSINFNISGDKLPEGVVTPAKTSFFTKEVSANLFDKNSNGIVSSSYINPLNGSANANSSFKTSDCIPIVNARTYIYPVYSSFFGGNAKYLALYDTNKNYIGYATGTVTNDYNTVTINNSLVAYAKVNVAVSGFTPIVNDFMFVEGTVYPSAYIRYISDYTLNLSSINTAALQYLNPLHGKIAIFNGDSICNGTSVGSSDPTYGWGWAGRIGSKNNMSWNNYGISGGTIAYIDPAKHCISRSVANMRVDADYIILEGGTNDADLLGAGNLGTISTGYTAVLDDTTFSGAVESMFKQCIIKYPGKKIGFIIAQKMGVGASDTSNRKLYFNRIMEICKKWGIPYLNLWDEHYLNPNIAEINSVMYTDGQHLTTAGYSAITPRIEAWMKTL